MTALRIGVLSFAHTHALSYLTALQAMPGAEVVGTDPDGTSTGTELTDLRGRELADALGVAYVDSVEELLAQGVDAVVVTSENARHRALVEQAAAAGVHVLCEKPLATTWEDGLAMRAAAEAAGVLLMVAFPVRFAGTFARLAATKRAGRLGEVFSVRGANNGMLPLTRSWFTEPELSGGGAIVDHVVHIADLLDELLDGTPAVTVTAVTNRVLHAARAQAETAGLVTITYADGTIAAIDCSWGRPDTSPTWGGLALTVVGSEGSVDVDFFRPSVRGLDAATGRSVVLPYGPDFDQAMLETFVTAVRSGEQPQPDAAVGLRTLAVVLAAQESAASGETVRVRSV
ncbi:dehydrogenase [Curtobacterium citreum]|uniref:Gfo/Idh/MocA family oxidoreductase n=1 Tax=Curtobacterium citreum TaxID=2036 RepID=A0ABT2HJJ0_9MICO|nr:Gfo/Idh/MocA family oxidoreductase [Curtobacterium citreum]MCS6523282.1 Gfo/Idh/MocA family oxidoreductase [Curtobacterium citreum]TQJ26954.1 putative dehydrogenase [Curtobacterium citreum]GGL90661.1 dehydrogenase [Curtobacterium citreum]